MPKLKLTKSNIDKLAPPVKGQIDYFDTELKGFGIRVSATTKTYFALARVNGSLTRVSFGKHGVMTPEQARQEAKLHLGQMHKGVNTNKEKHKAREKGITLKKAYEQYIEIRKPKPHTTRVDSSLLNCHLGDWLDKPIASITKEMVAKRHLTLRDTVGNNTANNTFRLFRRIYNCTNATLDDSLPLNPVSRLSDAKQWAKVSRRQTIIKDSDLPAWYSAVQALQNPYMRNYLLLQLFTGLRKGEGLSIRWKDVDMENKTFTIQETKNGKTLTLPMSDFIFNLFEELQSIKLNDFVFPALTNKSKSGHMAEPKRQLNKVKGLTGIEFCLHDQRRTFKTIAQDTVTKSESDRLTNHTSRDAGDGYVILSVDKLRIPMQKITDKILVLTKAHDLLETTN